MRARKPLNPAEAKRIAALKAERLAAARQESVQIRQEALERALTEISKLQLSSDSSLRSKQVKALSPTEKE